MNAGAQIEERAAQWLARKDRADWNDDQARELDAWLDQSSAHRVAYLRLHATWQRAERLSVLRAPVKEFGLPIARAPLWPALGRLAAGFAVLAVLGGGFVAFNNSRHSSEHAYSTEIGMRATVPLADGSNLELNTDTSIRADVGADRRTIWLDKGEAYFQVAHDAAHPFVVRAGDRSITVLGTKFSVRRDGDRFEVVVAEGRVRVAAVAARPIVITRGDVVLARGQSVLLKHESPEQLTNELSWRQGILVFGQSALGDVVEEFNRYNRQKLVIGDVAAAKIRIGGSFEANNINAFVRLLQTGFGVRVVRHGETIIISS